MGASTTLCLRWTPEMTTSLACTIATTAQPKRAAISKVTITHRAHAKRLARALASESESRAVERPPS